MNLTALFTTRLKALLRDAASLTVLMLCIAIALLAGWYSQQKQDGLLTLALVNEDAGELGGRLTAMLAEEDALNIVNTDVAAARRLLLQDRVQCLTRIPEDFSARLKERDYRDLVELTVSAGSAYAATVSEPLVNAIMKLWFEQQALYDAEAFLQEQGLTLSPARRQKLELEMERIWQEGARVRVDTVILADGPGLMPGRADPALCWYAALVPFYLILSCGWMQQQSYHSLLSRIRRTGCTPALSFLTQGAASLVMTTSGFILTAWLSGSASALPTLLPHLLLYGLSCMGMALVICSLCRNFSTLLLIASTLTLAAAALSGLLLELPDWASVWVAISNALPGRCFHMATTGQPQAALAWLQAALWLAVGLLCACLPTGRSKRHSTQGVTHQ